MIKAQLDDDPLPDTPLARPDYLECSCRHKKIHIDKKLLAQGAASIPGSKERSSPMRDQTAQAKAAITSGQSSLRPRSVIRVKVRKRLKAITHCGIKFRHGFLVCMRGHHPSGIHQFVERGAVAEEQ